MDLEFSDEQRLLDETLASLFAELAGPSRSRELAGHLDQTLLDRLDNEGFLDIAQETNLLEALFLVERAAEAVVCAPLLGRALVAPALGLRDVPATIGLVASPTSLVRYAGECDAYLFLDGDTASLASRDDVDVEPVTSRSFYPLGRVRAARAQSLGEGSGAIMRRAWQAGIAGEIGAMGLMAVQFAAAHVTDRIQFDRPIGSFQAVQNRLARSYSMAMASRWLARRAVWHHEDEFLSASAASFACLSARETYDNTHQVTGGIGITTEYGLVEWTIRLLTLHSELGGGTAHARRVAQVRKAHLAS